MSPSLAEHLKQARHARFVGREGELNLFLDGIPRRPSAVLCPSYFWSRGRWQNNSTPGVHSHRVKARMRNTTYLDVRHVEPAPEPFLHALRLTLNIPPEASIPNHLSNQGKKWVILLDTYETLSPLEDWLRISFLPELPETVLTVLAGRNPPAPSWRADPGWHSLLQTIPLRNLSPDEGREYLDRCGIPPEQQEGAFNFTHGHPLALSLIADLFSQRGKVGFTPEESPDVVKTLLERFIQQVPGPAHRAALEACALARVMTESLLDQMLDMRATSTGPSKARANSSTGYAGCPLSNPARKDFSLTIWRVKRLWQTCTGATPTGTVSCTIVPAPITQPISKRAAAWRNSAPCWIWSICIARTRSSARSLSFREASCPN